MRNFTLGSKGMPLFLFALLLFSATFASYGQCPTVDAQDATQYFCDSQEAEIGALMVTSGTNVNWYSSQSSTNPIANTTFLIDGTTYYAGTDGSCAGSRAEVTVSIASEPEILGIKSSNAIPPSARRQSLAIIGICVADVNDPGVTVGDLRTNAADEDQVNWYYNRTDTTPIPKITELKNNTDYFASIVSEDGNCETNRKKTTVRLFSEPAPTGPATQEFCAANNPTLGDLEVSGDNHRFFTTATSQTELSPNTPLVDEKTYYVSSIGDNCESTERLAVTVILKEANAGNFANREVCSSEGLIDLGDYLAASGATPGGTFSGEGVENNMFDASLGAKQGGYLITYTISETDINCLTGEPSSQFTITVQDAPLSGNIPLVFCVAQARELIEKPEDAVEYLSGLLEVQEVTVNPNYFGPTAAIEVGRLLNYIETPIGDSETFDFTYTTPPTDVCGEGVITITVTINAGEEANAGDFADQMICSADGMIDLTEYIATSGATPGGTFSGEGVENNMFDASLGAQQGGYLITYTVNGPEDTCITGASSQFTINVQNAPVSGNIPLNFCIAEVQEIVQEEPDAEEYITVILEDMGVNVNPVNFADGDGDELGRLFNYIQNPDSESETFNFTYTTPATGNCNAGVITIEVTINNGEEANAGDFADQTVCSADGMIDLTDYIAASGATPGGTFSGVGVENNMFDASLGAQQDGYVITYTVSDSEDVCITGEPSSQFTITVRNAPFSGNIPLEFCIAEAREIVQEEPDAEEYITEILNDMGVNVNPVNFADGDDDELGRLFNYIQNPDSESEIFNFTYTTPANKVCDEGVITIVVTINQGEEAYAGDFADEVVCSADGMIDLTKYIAASGATPGGTFSGEGVENNMFNASLGANDGGYLITYTIGGDSICVTGEDFTTFTINITEIPNAGNNNSDELCQSDIEEMLPSVTAVKNYYLSLLGEEVSRNGTFNPTIQELADRYTGGDRSGDFKTLYTLGSGNCTASVELIVTVFENPNAGENGTLNFTIDETDSKDLISGLNGTPEDGGIWTFEGNEVGDSFDPTTDTPGAYTYTVTNANGCSASAIVTVTVEQDSTNCPEVTDTTPTLCAGSTVAELMPQDAAWYASADATDALTTDTALTDGGEYFAGDAAGECNARVMVTVTLVDAPIAPTVTAYSACAITGATVADLGDNITGDDDATFNVYTDAEMNDMLDDTEVLVNGTYYVTQTSAAGCESAAAMLEVTLTDTDAPTLVQGGNVFCEFDGATIAELEEKITAGGDLTWYTTATGDETYTTAEVLENGVTYYVSSTPTGDCESSTRLAVTITLKTCEIVIPEIFSPNGDKINDEFVIENLASEYPNYKLEIYNRWGEPVYKGNASTPNWDGTSTEGSFGSGVLPAGVYFYILYYNDGTTPPTQGRVYLSR